MTPLRDAAREAEPSYLFVRCAAVYQSGAEWTGKKRLGEDGWNRVSGAVEMMVTAATILRAEKMSGDEDHIMEVTLRDIRDIADLYLERFEANYAATGQAWGDDAVYKDDLSLCSSVAKQLADPNVDE